MWAISLPVSRSWWTSHQELGTLYQVRPDPPCKELWHLGKLLLSCMFEPIPGLLCSPAPGDSHHIYLGYTAHTVRASEQPCCGCLCISSHYPQSKGSLRFLLLKKHIISLQISLQYSPLLMPLIATRSLHMSPSHFYIVPHSV